MGTAKHKGDVAFEGAVDLSEATVTMPTAALTDEDNVDWAGDHSFAGAVDLSDATVTYAEGFRVLAADAACTIAAGDKSIELNLTTGVTAVTMTGTHAGHRVRIYAGVRSGGSATIACTRGATSGTVTIDAVGEGADLVYTGSVWKLEQLLGTAAFA